MTAFYAKSGASGVWAPTTAYATGVRRVPRRIYATSAAKKFVYEVTAGGGGNSGSGDPTWNTTVGGTTSDGALTWTTRECDSWTNAGYHVDYLVANRCVAGDIVYVSSAHHESVAVTYPYCFECTNTSSGIRDAPIRVVSVDDSSGAPPVTAAAGAIIEIDSTMEARIGEGAHHFEGLTIICNSNLQLKSDANYHSYGHLLDGCSIQFTSSCQTGPMTIGMADPRGCLTRLWNTSIDMAAARACIVSNWFSGQLVWEGGAYTGAAVDYICGTAVANASFSFDPTTISGVDLSALGSGKALVGNVALGPTTYRFAACKMPSDTIMRPASPLSRGVRIEARDCDATTNHRSDFQDYSGVQSRDAGVYMTGGAADETPQPISWKIITTGQANFYWPFRSEEIAHYWADVGSLVTVCVEITSSVELTDAEAWIEFMLLDTSGVALGTWYSDRAATILSTPATQDLSPQTWTGGQTYKQSLTKAVTPRVAGYIYARVCVARPSTTVYVNPQIMVG